jgi:DNA-binding CsgD family transcriptional regulator
MNGARAGEEIPEPLARGSTDYLREANTALGTKAAFEAIESYDVTELLPQVRCPTLVIHRRGSRVLAASVARGLVAQIPGSRLVTLEGGSPAPFIGDVDSVVSTIEEFLGEPQTKSPDGLTPREVQVLRLVAAGRSNREIAEDLSLSERTVARHVTNIYGKIDAHSKAEATAYAFRHNMA